MALQKFETREFSGWATNITKKNHIDTLYPRCPQMVADFMVELLSRNFGMSLESILNRFPVKEFENDEKFWWDVVGSSRRNIPLVEARKFDGTVVTSADNGVGANGEPFFLVFGEKYFFDGEVILGNLNEVFPLRITAKEKLEGTNYVYEVELINGRTDGMPGSRLLAGEKFSYAYAPVERGLSKGVGGVRYVSPSTMSNEFSTIRIKDEVSGDVYGHKIAMGVPVVKKTESGKMQKTTDTMWMHYWEYEFEKTWREYKNNLYAYSTSNRNANGEYLNYGKSGEVIRMGDGLLAQLKRGNVVYYNKFSLKVLEDTLLAISTSKLELSERKFVLRTGERGALQFHKAVRDTVSGWTEFTYNGDNLGIVKKDNSQLHQNALQAGYQFTKFLGPNGIELSVEVDPFYDDPVMNKVMHPNGGVAQSYRYDIFDIGTSSHPNIFKVGVKGQPTEARSVMWGIRDPYTGRWGNPNASFEDDKAIITKFGQFGLCILDPTRTASVIPSLLSE